MSAFTYIPPLNLNDDDVRVVTLAPGVHHTYRMLPPIKCPYRAAETALAMAGIREPALFEALLCKELAAFRAGERDVDRLAASLEKVAGELAAAGRSDFAAMARVSALTLSAERLSVDLVEEWSALARARQAEGV